jgi:hypothetical protein
MMNFTIRKNIIFIGSFLLLSFSFQSVYSQNQVSAFENYIHSLSKDVTEKCKTTESLTEDDLADLPIGIAPKGCGGTTVILVVDSAYRAERGGWFFSMYASVILPGTSTPLAFSATNIAFNQGGLAASTSTKLVLVSNHSVQVNENLRIELPGDGRNFIEFDCNGFKSINLKGNFIFSKSFLVPDPIQAPGKTDVTASFEINTSDLSNILMAVNITPFKISGLNDLSFEVKNAVADYSDIINPGGFILPQDYQQLYGSDIQLWRGFYLGEVNIRVAGFSGDEKKPLTISAKNLLIDDLGVSGWLGASNIISLNEGSAGGWPMSIDKLSVKLLFNKVAGGSLEGALSIPMLGDEPVSYTAQIEQVEKEVNYRFSISTPSSKEFNAPFSAKIRIAEGSVIALEKTDGKFMASALLHGDITVDNKSAKFKGIKFQNLGLTTRKPYITSGIFSTMSNKDADDGQNKSVGFPIRIDSVNLRVYEGQAAIGFAVSLNLMNKESKGFSAATFIQVLAKLEETTVTPDPNSEGTQTPQTRQRWEFEKIKINDIKLEAKTTAFELAGMLRIFDNDPTYGDGFMGSLSFKIAKIMSNPAKITAYFGSKETYRYWHLDAYVPTKIPIPPAISINGLMGGASYHMVRQKPFIPDFNEIDPQKMAASATTSLSNDVVYLPDEKSGISFLAGITLVVGNENAINADAMFEINFNEHGGMRYAQFSGTAFFFTGIKDRGRTTGGTAPKAPVYASLNMLFDNDNNVFHANLKTYMNVAGLIKGVGQNNLVGEAVIHTDPKDWYVYIGRPSQMFGVDIASLAVAKTYFMIGTKIENIPPPPPEVREVFDDIEEGLMRDEGSMAGGRGFALGAHFKVGFDERFGPFYAAFAVGAGADVMLRDYGDAYCEGRTGRIGIDGWYASGQAYVFLKGKVGIRVRGAKFDILSLGAAALLQAKLPNPAWMKGRLGGRYSILGGLVKGKFNIKFTVGEKCEIVNPGGELGNIQVIADLKPDASATDVNVFTAPQASFNTSLDTDFTMMDMQDNVVTYRIRLSEFSVMKDNAILQSSIEWNATKDVAALRTFEILPPQSKLTAKVKLYWEKKSSTGSWEPIKVDNEILYEVKETSFTTGTAPDFIPEENVAYSYPVKNQYNFHISEQGTGYVKLRMGQAYLFEQGTDGTQWTYSVKFQNAKSGTIEVPLTYDVAKAQATFEIPQSLSKQTIYKFFFVKHPTSTGTVDQNATRTEVNVDTGEENETTVASNTLQGTITQAVDKDLYTSAMRTSQFATFSEKWTTFSNGQDLFDIATGNVAVIGKRGNISETFDEVELRGREGQSKPLVQIIASAETEWMKNYAAPMLYDQYPVDEDITLSWRDPQVLGVKPLKGVKLTNDQGDYRLTDANVTAGSASAKIGTIVFGYYLPWYGFKDFNDLRNQAAQKYLNDWGSAPTAAKKLLSAGAFADLIRGNYPIEIKYSLPGTNQVTYQNQVIIKY